MEFLEKINANFARGLSIRGVYRLKHHFVVTERDVIVCKSVTDSIKKVEVVVGLQQRLMKKQGLMLRMMI